MVEDCNGDLYNVQVFWLTSCLPSLPCAPGPPAASFLQAQSAAESTRQKSGYAADSKTGAGLVREGARRQAGRQLPVSQRSVILVRKCICTVHMPWGWPGVLPCPLALTNINSWAACAPTFSMELDNEVAMARRFGLENPSAPCPLHPLNPRALRRQERGRAQCLPPTIPAERQVALRVAAATECSASRGTCVFENGDSRGAGQAQAGILGGAWTSSPSEVQMSVFGAPSMVEPPSLETSCSAEWDPPCMKTPPGANRLLLASQKQPNTLCA